MKRLIYSNTKTEELLLDLDVEVVVSGTILSSEEIPYDFQDSAFYAFESDILNACEIHGFELQDSYASNRNGSNSQYYVYIKTNEDGTVTVGVGDIEYNETVGQTVYDSVDFFAYDNAIYF